MTLSLVTFLTKPSIFLASQSPCTLSWWFQRPGKSDPEILFLSLNTSSALFLLNMTLHWCSSTTSLRLFTVPCHGHRIWLSMKSSVSPVSLEVSELPFLSRLLEGGEIKLFPTPTHEEEPLLLAFSHPEIDTTFVSSALIGSLLLKGPLLWSYSSWISLYNISCAGSSKAVWKSRSDFILMVIVTLLQFQKVNEEGFPFTEDTPMPSQQNSVHLCVY